MAIQVKNISKGFDGHSALKDLSLHIDKGDFVALLGPSGSGKTTLLRIIAGLAFADSGQVIMGDRDMTQVPVQGRGIGFVFQNYALFRHMTVAKNIAFGLDMMKRSERPAKSAIQERVAELLDMVQMPGLGERYPAQLSGGQRQRVALARAIARNPRYLLLDEPFGALDAKVRKDLRVALRDIHDRLGITTLFVTHDRDEAFALADKVAILNGGKIAQYAAPKEIEASPADDFVREFLA
ncbi:MAG: ATP-binding cassette domain-containing protein [Sphingobium sp.]|nr:ATP-binding cassette domain-containing protein [Sphingobium sp.]MCI1271847.1 ATP-binding cassette domain-containing protein [Sphingobium sp.]MCI1757066.1 ATP-binding cassette domain-containing protein [Sphingobium sp.]MCI2052765.1 ATP-binding cassette domain-containing protein [Sphingobium sp.]